MITTLMTIAWPPFAGAAGGLAAVCVPLRPRRFRRKQRTDTGPDLTAEDRNAVASEFAVHAAAVATQLSTFADELADGDPVLRERLRRLECENR